MNGTGLGEEFILVLRGIFAKGNIQLPILSPPCLSQTTQPYSLFSIITTEAVSREEGGCRERNNKGKGLQIYFLIIMFDFRRYYKKKNSLIVILNNLGTGDTLGRWVEAYQENEECLKKDLFAEEL